MRRRDNVIIRVHNREPMRRMIINPDAVAAVYLYTRNNTATTLSRRRDRDHIIRAITADVRF